MIKNAFRALGFAVLMLGSVAIASAQDPSAASLYNDGLEKAKAKEYAKALTLFEKAMEAADPEDDKGARVLSLSRKNAARAAYALGFQHRKNKEYDKAMAMYEKGAGYNPDYHSNFQGIAQVYEAKEMKAEAVAAYLTAGDVAMKSGKKDKVQALYDKAANIVELVAVDGDWDLTMACVTAFTEGGQEAAEVYYAAAKAYDGQGDASAAIEQVDKAIGLAGAEDASKFYYLKGECHAKLGQKSAAIEAYGKVTEAKYAERARYEIDQLNGG